MNPWIDEETIVDESAFTPWGHGWSAWNERAPEVEFADFVGSVVRLMRPANVVETGVGMGYVTRRILENLASEDDLLWAFESDEDIRALIPATDKRLVRCETVSPPKALMETADLFVFDSRLAPRLTEISDFARYAKEGAVLICHDVAKQGAGPVQATLRDHLLSLKDWVTGAFLPHPRGSWIGTRI